jgi:hypothetical protein
MKYTILPLIAIIALFGTGCNNDFDLIEEGIDTPIVYGFIDIGSDTQYIRVEKAFAGEDLNAFDGAQIEDSLYYKNAVVRLVNEETNESFEFERINGVDVGIIRDEGDFLKDPNVLYRAITSDLKLQGGENVRLEIERGDDLPVVEATTTVLSRIELNRPEEGESVNFTFSDFSVQLRVGDETQVMGLLMNMYITETNVTDPTDVRIVTIPWRMANSALRNGPGQFQFPKNISGKTFYSTIAANLDATLPVRREFSSFDIIVEGAGKEILEYKRIAQANTGLTGAEELPLYSNISEGGIGIFSSKYHELYEDFTLKPQTRDSLANGSVCGHLNFVF